MPTKNPTIDEEIRKLVIARLETFPKDRGIFIGSQGEFTREDLIEHVKQGDEIGNSMVEMDLEYLRMLKDEDFFEYLTSDET